jgi:hypothetical protein
MARADTGISYTTMMSPALTLVLVFIGLRLLSLFVARRLSVRLSPVLAQTTERIDHASQKTLQAGTASVKEHIPA